MNMSATFSAFNLARNWARRSGLTDEGRVNRALGILKKKGAFERAIVKYNATVDHCDCYDSQSGRSFICKHRIAVMMFKKHQRLMNADLGLELSEEFEPTGDYDPSVDTSEPTSIHTLEGWHEAEF